MRNILSYEEGHLFLGQEINEWCKNQLINHSSHYKEAKRLHFHYNLKDNKIYQLKRMPFGPGTDQCRGNNKKVGFIKYES